MNLYRLIEKFSNSNSKIYDNNNKISYKNLFSYSDKLTKYISERSLVLILTSKTIDSLIGLIGLSRGNHVIILLNNAINDFSLN